MEVDELDLKILELLQENGKMGYREMAEKLNTNASTIFNRVRSLETNGIIRKYTAILNPDSLGYEITAVIMIRANGPRIVDIEKELASMPEVSLVYDITGEFDIMVGAKFKDRNSLNKFVKKVLALQGVERTTTNLVLNVVKEEPALPIQVDD
ncbi:Lrp/AsnC family transcriptional regulator [Tardisphaera saccharovorans]